MLKSERQKRRLQWLVPGLLVLTAGAAHAEILGNEYFISNKTTHGEGTLANPWGIPDLHDFSAYFNNGPALNALQPGDTLTFLGGTYQMPATAYDKIFPVRSGLPGLPITFRAKPGQSVVLLNAPGGYGQPTLSNSMSGTHFDYINFQGFTTMAGADGLLGGGVRITGEPTLKAGHIEVRYNKIVGNNAGAYWSNHDGLWVENAYDSRFHHNEITGWQCDVNGSSAIKTYTSSNLIFEDNRLHGNKAGIQDKESGMGNQYRRNWFSNDNQEFIGPNQGDPNSHFDIYENVIDGHTDFAYLNNHSSFHDNLVRGTSEPLSSRAPGNAPGYKNTRNVKAWNNVVLSGAASPLVGYWQPYLHWTPTGPDPNFEYMNHNVYDRSPTYEFGNYDAPYSTFNLTEMQAQGFETNSTVVDSGASVYEDQVNYLLKTSWATAGRYGDPVGPDNVAQILDASRYGPSAVPIPVAMADAYTTAPGTALVLVGTGVLANDTATGGEAIKAVKLSNPAHGTLTLNASGGFTYTPAAGYTGTDSFTYRAENPYAESDAVTVTITMVPEPAAMAVLVVSGLAMLRRQRAA